MAKFPSIIQIYCAFPLLIFTLRAFFPEIGVVPRLLKKNTKEKKDLEWQGQMLGGVIYLQQLQNIAGECL